jgi:chromosome segregation ATPase
MSKIVENDRNAKPEPALERRRSKTQRTRKTADQARARVADLDREIDANSSRTRDYETALQKAQAEVTWLKKALKTTAKQRDRLGSDRAQAAQAAAKAYRQAQKAESKYDESVLDEIVRREKLSDLDRDHRAPAPETVDLGTSTATKVAARTTADNA